MTTFLNGMKERLSDITEYNKPQDSKEAMGMAISLPKDLKLLTQMLECSLEALEYYGDGDNYGCYSGGEYERGIVDSDAGDRAQDTLKQIVEMAGEK